MQERGRVQIPRLTRPGCESSVVAPGAESYNDMDPLALTALLLAAVATLWLMRQRAPTQAKSREPGGKSPRAGDALDTVAAWPPEATRVLTQAERRSHDMLKQALPEYMVLAQLPLPRFVRVPTRNSYQEWMHRVSQLCADLVVCDADSQVLAVIEVRRPPGKDSERTKKRHDRMDRVLTRAGIKVLVWNEEALPAYSSVREQVLGATQEATHAPTVPVPAAQRAPVEPPTARQVTTLTEVLGDPAEPLEFDLVHQRAEPTPSTWFDNLESSPVPLDPLRR
jgi:hypothetical protein